jgi:hypothetical protein
MSVVSLVLAPWFVRVHGITVESTTAQNWVQNLFQALFG